MDGKNKKGDPEGDGQSPADDLVDWCNKDICTLCGLASDRKRWSRAHGVGLKEEEDC